MGDEGSVDPLHLDAPRTPSQAGAQRGASPPESTKPTRRPLIRIGRRHRRRRERCPNCDRVLAPDANYCGHCGQENHDHRAPMRELGLEVFESLTHLDHRVLHTLRDLLLRPGQVAIDYNAGKRARYLPPFRLFLVASILFFAASNVGEVPAKPRSAVTIGETQYQRQQLEAIRGGDFSPFPAEKQRELAASATQRMLARGLATIGLRKLDGTGDVGLRKYTERSVFWLVPIFAFLIRVLAPLPKPFLVDAVVFSLFTHAVVLGTGALVPLAERLPGGSVAEEIWLLASLAWTTAAARRFWSTSWAETAFRAFGLFGLYFGSLVLSFLAVLVLAFLF
jgi:hypothetical protein